MLINFRFGILRHLSKINLAMYVHAFSLKEAMEYDSLFLHHHLCTFCDGMREEKSNWFLCLVMRKAGILL